MNNTQRQIINMLNSSIHKKNVEIDENEVIDWNEIMEEGDAHKVTPLLYASIDRRNISKLINPDIFNNLKKQVFISSLGQSSHIKNVASILEEFNKADIPVIVLKD